MLKIWFPTYPVRVLHIMRISMVLPIFNIVNRYLLINFSLWGKRKRGRLICMSGVGIFVRHGSGYCSYFPRYIHSLTMYNLSLVNYCKVGEISPKSNNSKTMTAGAEYHDPHGTALCPRSHVYLYTGTCYEETRQGFLETQYSPSLNMNIYLVEKQSKGYIISMSWPLTPLKSHLQGLG